MKLQSSLITVSTTCFFNLIAVVIAVVTVDVIVVVTVVVIVVADLKLRSYS